MNENSSNQNTKKNYSKYVLYFGIVTLLVPIVQTIFAYLEIGLMMNVGNAFLHFLNALISIFQKLVFLVSLLSLIFFLFKIRKNKIYIIGLILLSLAVVLNFFNLFSAIGIIFFPILLFS